MAGFRGTGWTGGAEGVTGRDEENAGGVNTGVSNEERETAEGGDVTSGGWYVPTGKSTREVPPEVGLAAPCSRGSAAFSSCKSRSATLRGISSTPA